LWAPGEVAAAPNLESDDRVLAPALFMEFDVYQPAARDSPRAILSGAGRRGSAGRRSD